MVNGRSGLNICVPAEALISDLRNFRYRSEWYFKCKPLNVLN